MANRTLSISMPDNLANFVESEVKKGDYASASDFMRILIRDYQARNSERWIERLVEQRRASAQDPANLIEQDAFEREILGHNVSETAN
jgi:putative addiction module CopG family antidote